MAEDFKWEVSSLAGARLEVFRMLGKHYSVEEPFKKKWKKSKRVAIIMNGLAFFDRIRFYFLQRRIKKIEDPIFVIGHWRSGTTLLHNVLCDITDASYCTTYQNAFPNNLFAFYHIIRPAVQHYMPDRRPADQVELHTLLPQEEEFAIGNEIPYCFYYWMFFPKNILELSDQFLTAKKATAREKERWKKNYVRFIKRCLLRTKGKRFVSKNPPNTARIEMLLELFPNAKFIFLHRNPYDTASSSFRFFKGVLPAQQHQRVDSVKLEQDLVEIYKQLHQSYIDHRNLIPVNNLVEISFDEFVSKPLQECEKILEKFGIEAEVTEDIRSKYHQDDHEIKAYHHSDELINLVNDHLSDYIAEYNYERQTPVNSDESRINN